MPSGATASPVTSADVKWSWQAIVNPNDNVISRHGYDVVRADRHARRAHRRRAPQTPLRAVRQHVLRRKRSAVRRAFRHTCFRSIPTSIRCRSTKRRRRATVRSGSSRGRTATASSLQRTRHFSRAAPVSSASSIEFVPDENTAINLLRTHAIDYIYQPSISTYPALKERPGRRAGVGQRQRATKACRFNVSHPVVSDPRVRLGHRPCIRQVRLGAPVDVRSQQGRDRRHSRLDVGVRPQRPFVSLRRRRGANAAAPSRLRIRRRRDGAQRRPAAAAAAGHRHDQRQRTAKRACSYKKRCAASESPSK